MWRGGEVNAFALIVATAVIAGGLLEALSLWLDLRWLRRPPPAALADLYPPDEYLRSQRYTRERRRLGVVASAVSMVAFLGFWGAGGFRELWQIAQRWGPGTLLEGFLFVAQISALAALLGLPFDLYGTFVVEERYGFNRTSLRTWMADRIKATALAVVVGGPLLLAVLWFFETLGGWAWLVSWAAVAAVSVAVQHVFPTWILPWFNRLDPLPAGELREALVRCAAAADFPVDEILVMDGSRRSSKANAFFTGFGRRKRIVLFDTLVDDHPVDELVAVLAHEIGHFKLRHVLANLAIGLVHTGVLFGLLAVVLREPGLFRAFGLAEPAVAPGLVFFTFLLLPVDALLGVGLLWLSRRFEHAADRFACRITGRPESLAAALRRLSADSLANLTPHPLRVWTSYSHPPLARRLAVIERTSGAAATAG